MSADSTEDQVPEDAGRVRQRLTVLGLTAVLLGLAGALSPYLSRGDAFLPGPTLPWWALAIAFAATEVNVLHIQHQREARTISLSELPLVLGLFFASPVSLVLGRLVGSVAVLVLYRRSPALKTTFNLGLFAAETAVAVAVFSAITTWTDGHVLGTWLGAYAAALTTGSMGALAISLVIAAHEGGLRLMSLLRGTITGLAVAPMVVTLALVAVTSLGASPQSTWLLVAFGILLLLAYRAYASLAHRHLNLERLYRFSQAVSSAPEVDEVLRRVLSEAKELLRSERASIGFVVGDGGLVGRVRLGVTDRLSRAEEPPGPEDRWLLQQVVGERAPLLLPRNTRDPASRRLLDKHAMREAVAVPLRGTAGVLGVLVVADRMGDIRTYDENDVLLLETVANHASVALQNGELIGRLRHEALHDALTGLPNRVQLQRRLGEAIDDIFLRRSEGAAVMLLDLDQFKEINDTLGHQEGDLLLIEIGARLTTAVGNAGVVARLGGDEFAILVPGTGDEDRVRHVGRRLLRALEQPVALDGLEVEVRASIGVALAPAHAQDPAGLLKRADLAMHDAKVSAKGLRIYEPELETSPRRVTLVAELRAALNNGEIAVHVQPKAGLADGTVTGAEALVRWEHPELGRVSPDEFIPVAERSGLIGPLTTRVLDLSLAAVAGWRSAGHDLGIAVNLSTRSLHDADLVDEVARLLRRHDVPADRLTLEVTEGSVMADPARAVALLHQLRDLGVRLSVDDFGTGYSSLSYLKRLPVQEVKIDRSFVTGLTEDGEDVAIVRTIVDLGRHLGLQVVAEGVEERSTWELLASMGCDLAQGWYLGRPMPIGELVPWLRTRERAEGRGGLRVV
ncbi:putative bifunctional diguanylate cyclase/phosphodiesterase [Blastococcus deserti]|uniref:Bifunctional diguanylate cyclase/phosphodiesterase n=1 Tax=Blastococcus deserti TaxID=2259033 RepID=A0ABW4XD01_9ACTN